MRTSKVGDWSRTNGGRQGALQKYPTFSRCCSVGRFLLKGLHRSFGAKERLLRMTNFRMTNFCLNERGCMLDHATLIAVAEQLMSGTQVVVEGRASSVTRTGSRRFRTVRFVMGGRGYQAIEQNPEKPSRWGKLAREGRRVVQFRDLGTGKYVGVAVDGKVTEYGR
jgi:hypothetical protein